MRRLELAEPLRTLGVRSQRTEPFALSCIVPAFNEADGLSQFLKDLHDVVSRLCPRVEIILVDDGSEDETPVIAAGLVHSLGLHYIRLSRNFGKEAALTAGIDRAQGDVVLVMDADYQHPLEVLPAMLEYWRKGYDVVYGVRRDRVGEGTIKRIGTRLLYNILSADAPVPIPVAAGDFRLLDRKVVEALKKFHEHNRFMKGLYAWVGFSSIAIPFDVSKRRHGRSHFTLRKLLRLALDGITGFTNLPLRIWSAFGIVMSISALIYGGWVVVQTLVRGNAVAGWPTIVVSLMFFSGLQLISIGIIGEYLGRVFDEVKGRPIYIIREEIDCSNLTAGGSHGPAAIGGDRDQGFPQLP